MLRNISIILSVTFATQLVLAAETPNRRPRSSFETPTSEDKNAAKRSRLNSYDDMQIPEGFKSIVDFYSDDEDRQLQLKLLGAELWDQSNRRNPHSILTGSLALAFWYCTYKEDCAEFLEIRKPKDIDILVDDLSNHTYALVEGVKGKYPIIRGEKVIRYEICDDNFFGYDFILMGKNGLDFGSVTDLREENNGLYIPVIGISKLIELKKISGSSIEKNKEDLLTLNGLSTHENEACVGKNSIRDVDPLHTDDNSDNDDGGWTLFSPAKLFSE